MGRRQTKNRSKTKLTLLSLITLASVGSTFFTFFAVFGKKTTTPEPSQKKAVIISYENKQFEAETFAETVAQVLEEQNIQLQSDDYLFPKKETSVYPGINIVIQKKIPVTIKVDGETIELKTFTDSVEDALKEANVTLSHLDQVSPQKPTRTSRGLEIVVTRIEIEEIAEEKSIDFKIVKKEDPKLRWRQTKIKREGEKGIQKDTYRIVYHNGEQVSKEKISSKIAKKPKDQIVLHGTKIEVGKTSRGRASWYKHTGTLACASLEHPKGTWLKVTNRQNKKSVIVQVNDTGPYSEDKIIDLDAVAFERIGNLGQGVINVKVEEILE